MTRSLAASRLDPRKLAALFVLGAAVLAGSVVPALAKERQTMSQGVRACKAWCDGNNSTVGSQHACYVRCERYWMCNGSDSTTTTCADKPPLARGEASQPQPPQPAPGKAAVAPRRPAAAVSN